jgi:hypothetical protein
MPKVKGFNQQNQKLTEIFKIALVKNNWSQSHLAKLCGTTESQMSRIINFPEKCKFSSIQIVAKKLGIKELPII